MSRRFSFHLKQILHAAEGPRGSEVLHLFTRAEADSHKCYGIFILEPLSLHVKSQVLGQNPPSLGR